MIDEIFVINQAGLPIFYYKSKIHEFDPNEDKYIIQSSFFSAINTFAADVDEDNVRFVVFNEKSFALRKNEHQNETYVTIFGKFKSLEDANIQKTEKELLLSSNQVKSILSDSFPTGIDTLNNEQVIEFQEQFTNFLSEQNIIPITKEEIDRKFLKKRQKDVQNAIFKTLGYKPGQCNIGPVERQRRLITGFGAAIIGLLFLVSLIYLEKNFVIPRELRLVILPIPLFLAFQGFYQYFFKFCVTNALKKRYVMK